MDNKRIIGLDILRGSAVFLMIIYHIFYDLDHFGYIHIDMDNEWFWKNFRYLIVSAFLISAGISLKIAHLASIRWKSVLKRFILLGTISVAITLVTYIEFPNSWVYFGIIHFIWIASVLGLLFINKPFLTFLGIVFSFGWTIVAHSLSKQLFMILQKLFHLPNYTVDLVTLFPWFGVFLIGVLLVQYNVHTKFFALRIFHLDTFVNRLLIVSGKHALLIYLVHLPLLFSGFYLYRYLT